MKGSTAFGVFVIFLIFLSGCNESAPAQHTYREPIVTTVSEPSPPPKQESRYAPYISKIDYENIELRSLASLITKGCSSGDKECQLNSIYKYVVEDFSYYSDPRSSEFIQTPANTMKVNGGDCEDLSILLNSLLENIGFKTYLVFTDDHAYSLACGVDTKRLQNEILDSFNRVDSLLDETISLKGLRAKIYEGSGEEVNYPLKYTYSIQSSKGVNVYIVPSKSALSSWSEGESFQYYSDCSHEITLRFQDECSVNKYMGIMITNNNLQEAVVDIKVDITHQILDLENFSTYYYTIDEETCVILDPTLGKYGYPGYTGATGSKIAVDSITGEEISLT